METTCDQCGKQFVRKRSMVLRSKCHFCSRGCLRIGQTGSGNPHWKGAQSPQKALTKGYQRITVRGKHKAYHRYIMEQHLGYPLSVNQVVHHKDGNPTNNTIENLEIMESTEHTRYHASPIFVQCAYCGNVLKRFHSQLLVTRHSFCNNSERAKFYGSEQVRYLIS